MHSIANCKAFSKLSKLKLSVNKHAIQARLQKL